MRTIIQHAWAEIEHDLGYKSSTTIPDELRRRFFRLSALLEVADDEFATISREVGEYRVKVRGQIASGVRSVSINVESISQFVETDAHLRKLAELVATSSGKDLTDDWWAGSPELLAQTLKWAGFETLDDVDKGLHEREGEIVRLAAHRLSGHHLKIVTKVVPCLYLIYLILSERSDPTDQIDRFLKYDRGTGL